MMFLLVACAGSNAPAPEPAPPVETVVVDSGTAVDSETETETDTSTTTPTDDTATPSTICSADPTPVTDPDCPEGVAALVAGVTYTSVDEAVARATSGSTVEVCPGRWPTNAVAFSGVNVRGRAGTSATVLDGGGVGRVLTLDPTGGQWDSFTTIEGVTITNGYTTGDGGGIGGTVTGRLVLRSVCVQANHAEGDGGGMAATGAWEFELFDSAFSSNSAGGAGGGVAVSGARILAMDVAFEANLATDGGGAWYTAPYRNGGEAYFLRTTFEDNVATGLGGGLRFGETGAYSVSGVVADSIFRGNVADVGGGLGVSSTFGIGSSVSGTSFVGNRARLGGAIGGVSSDLVGTEFSGNSATEAGGAVYGNWVWGAGVRMERNTAPVGGGIALDGALLEAFGDFGTGASVNLPDDVALLVGGVAYAGLGAGAAVLCEDPEGCRFAPTSTAEVGDTGAPSDTGSSGTAAAGCDGRTTALVDELPYGSVGDAVAAASSGATVDICPGDWPANLVLEVDLTLRGAGSDATTLDGGGVGTVVSVPEGVSLTLSGLTLHGGYAEEGAGLYVEGHVEAGGVALEDNFATDAGGGVAVVGGGLTWSGGRIEGNTAGSGGGGIYQSGGSLAVSGASLLHNSARAGGGIFAADGTTTVQNVYLAENVAWAGSGGGLLVTGDPGASVLGGVTLTGNYAWSSAGGAYCDACSVSDLSAMGNISYHGGAVYLRGGSLTSSSLIGNQAIYGGGLLVAADGLVQDTEVRSNQAVYGGGVESWGGTLTRVTLVENRAVDGGGLYPSYGETTVEDATVTGNLADRGGGAWMEGGVLTSVTSDWGTGADENLPDDVASALSTEAGYGAAASFTCDAATGMCE